MRSNCDRIEKDIEAPDDSTVTLRDVQDSSRPEITPEPKYEKSASSNSDEEDFDLEHFLKLGLLEKRSGGRSQKRLGVIWKDVAVEGTGSTFSFIKTFPDAVIGTFGPDLYRILSRWIPILSSTKTPTTILSGFTGSVRDGEMMLVLGRPGSGCTTFLKTIANDRKTYSGVKGTIHYGHIPAEQQSSRYRGEVVYCSEDDVHFPALSVWRTVVFALWNKTKKNDKHTVPHIAKALLRMFGLSHAKNTFVGDAFLRGVSGGERKRVSIIETLTSKANVVCWDNSTRGLDSSTALDFARSLRTMTDISNRTTLVALYQTGESIYNIFDKVMLLDSGKCVYQGPVTQAKQYFVDLGFHCPDRMTTADFLTSVTDPIARRVRTGYELKAPRTAAELEEAYLASSAYQNVLKDVRDYEAHPSQHSNVSDFQQAVIESKSKYSREKSLYTVSFYRQVVNCTKREFWLLFNDWEAIYTKTWVILLNAFVVGSLFYGAAEDTSGAFGRGGGIFFSILFLGWVQLPELMKAVSGRTIVQRHKDYAFYRPSALAIARAIADAPVLLVETSLFSIVMYFMASFEVDAGKFWIYFLFVFTNTFCTTALYRLFASVSPTIDDAVRFSGVGFNIMIIYSGYVMPKRQLFNNSPWFGWLHWPNPIANAFEAVFSNEFSGRKMICAESNRIPRGPGIDPNYQGCLLQGSGVNNLVVTGEDYVNTAYDYHRTDLWRNFGVMLAFLIVYTLLSAIIAELFAFPEQNAGGMQYTKTARTKALAKRVPDEEVKGHQQALYQQESHPHEHISKLSEIDNVFTWQDVDYTVPIEGGEKQLLSKVSGYAKPGVMIALMGASGAGKTTLLNVLSQRQRVGVVTGDMLANGHPLTASFKRSTGFCEQMDIHDGTATIREALVFSAILRQDRHIPMSEKLAYVDKVLELLELEDVQDAVISSLGVDVRKRTTIGVELVAKPTLLFLDEPTSGIDSQSAFSIVHFLKKLTRAGQAIICTIHQPSSILFEQFDMVLALNPGGKTFYFGDVGPDGATIVEYFSRRGAPCPPTMNIAEFILETAIRGTKRADGTSIDWNAQWLASPERAAVSAEISRLSHLGASNPRAPFATEFAAPVPEQMYLLTKRVLLQHWRDPSYVYGKVFVSVIIGLFTGFTFYQLGNTITDLQDRVFTCFILAVVPSCIVNAILPKFYSNMNLWLAREYPSRIYGWVAFSTAQIVAELPYAALQSVLYFVLWYYPTGFPKDSGTAGYVFLMTLTFHVYQASWGQWICAWAPSYTVISNILPTFFVIFTLFCGLVRPWAQMPSPWRYFLYYATPSTYWAGGIVSAVLDRQPVQCTIQESARFLTPPGESCESYAGAFVAQMGGYLLPNSTAGIDVGQCAYCPYSTGNDYLATLNLGAHVKWPYLGIFMAFCVSNWALVYFFVWTVRVKGYSFGIGKLLRLFRAG